MIKDQPDWQNLIEQLSRASDEDAVEAAKSLSYQSHKDCMRSLTQFASSEQPPFRKELALSALAWMHNPQLVDTFVQVLKDTNEIENVRGQAAEGLGMLFDGNFEKIDQYHKAEKALLDHVSNSSPFVRCWCCYGLGNMRTHRGIEQLKAIQEEDHALCPGWWYVSEEAEDALARYCRATSVRSHSGSFATRLGEETTCCSNKQTTCASEPDSAA